MRSGWRICLLVLASALAVGCASTRPVAVARTSAGVAGNPEQAVMVALAMAGTPYRWGGADPDGFDCSGLVYYAYQRTGVEVPRTTEDQYRNVRRISLADLAAGDLVFFKLDGRISHVGLYTGDGRFVHAPSTGKVVSISQLDDDFWRRRLVAAGRFQQ